MIIFLEFDVQYLEKLHELHNDLPFLPERMKIEKVEKFVINLHEYVIHIRNLKQTLKSWISFKKVHEVVKFNQNAWLKPFIDTNTDLGKKEQKVILLKVFFKLMNN